MTDFPKYEQYRDSGVEWFGKVPMHWEVLANKYIFDLKKNLVGKKSKDYDLLSLTLKGIIKRDMENPSGKFPAEFDTYQEVRESDLVFCLFDVEETPRAVGLSEFNGMITGAYTVMTPKSNFSNRFLYYFYLNLDNDKRLKPLYRGLRNTVPKDSFFSFKSFVPPYNEQTNISTFLDKKTEQIDSVIAQKEKLIGHLQERRRIMINQAVTRGLNAEAKMKGSEVEWIGAVPTHWKIVRPKFFFEKFEQGWSPQCYNYPAQNNQWGVLKVGCVNGFSFRPEQNKVLPPHLKPKMKYKVNTGDILISRANSTELVGSAAIVPELDNLLILCDKLYRVKINEKKLVPEFFIFYIKSNAARKQIELGANGASSSMQNIGQGVIKNMWMTLPPYDEQVAIVDFINNANDKLDKSIYQSKQQIQTLKEYKTTLINAAVTGQIKVGNESN